MIQHKLLEIMKKIRVADEAIADRYHEQEMRCPTHLSIGQEAVSAGVGAVLKKDDFVVSTHRSHGHYIAKGGSINRMIAELYGKSTGCSGGRGGSMNLVDISVGFMGSTAIVGGTIPIGVGLGLSIDIKKTNQISCVFLGDAAIEEGVFYESLNFAAVRKLPVLFICENNGYSIYTDLKKRQPEGRKIWELAQSIGAKADFGDGNDVLSVHQMVENAVTAIREGFGPIFLEFSTSRWREHCGPNFDDDLGYRPQEEVDAFSKNDPIKKLENYLLENNKLSLDAIKSMDLTIKALVDTAFDFAQSSPFPASDALFNHIYKEVQYETTVSV